MAVTLVGLVFYAEQGPTKPFRWVYPTEDDAELDDPRWVTEGCDPSRNPMMVKVLRTDPRAIHDRQGASA